MTSEQKQILRCSLLMQLECTRRGLPLATLKNGARAAGFDLPEADIVSALDWLVSKGYAAESRAEFSNVLRLWKITDAGLESLDT